MIKNIIIIGAGDAGKMLAKEILYSKKNKDYNILCFLDDDENKKEICSIKVKGKINDIEKIAKEYKSENINIDEIIIAIPTLEQKELEKILNSISSTGIKHKIVPGIFEIIRGNFSLKDIRRIEPSDLLGREEIGFDEKEIYDYYKNKIILVTGGGGSIGSELVRQLITLPIKKVLALDNSESAIHSLIMSINLLENKDKFKYIISNVRDYIKIDKILKEYKPEFKIYVSIVVGIIIFFIAADKLSEFINLIMELSSKLKINNSFINILLKILLFLQQLKHIS